VVYRFAIVVEANVKPIPQGPDIVENVLRSPNAGMRASPIGTPGSSSPIIVCPPATSESPISPVASLYATTLSPISISPMGMLPSAAVTGVSEVKLHVVSDGKNSTLDRAIVARLSFGDHIYPAL
jgi:hypothetical protein